MRLSNRKSHALAIVSAAASLAATMQFATAQTWVNPNTGAWSSGANWVGGVAPASSNATQLTFNAVAAQTYTATNDIANPFLLNLMTLNNTGTGQINVAGSQLSFGGANPGVNNNGSGVSSIANNIQSNTAGVPLTFGGTGIGTTNLSGGGTLYAINGARGAVNITGGTWTLTSTNRRNDNAPVPPIDDGFWSLNIGDVAGQTSRFTMSGGSMNAEHGMVGIRAGAIGIATFTGASTVAVFNPNAPTASRFGISDGQGTYTVTNGASVTGNFLEVGRQLNSTANMFVSGGGTINAVQQVLIARLAGSNGSLTVSGAGRLNGGSNSFMAPATGTTATLNVTGAGSRFANVGVLISSGGSLVAGGVSTINVSAGGQITSERFTFVQDAGGISTVNIDGPGSAINSVGIGAGTGSWASGVGENSRAVVNVTNGGTIGTGGALFMSGGIVDGVGDPIPSGTTTFNVTGAGGNTSTASIGFLQMAQSPNGQATYNANTLSTTNVGTNLIVGLDPTGSATLNVNGANAIVNTVGFVAPFPATDGVGDPIPGGNGNVAVTGGGRINLNSYGATVAFNPDQVGIVTISGTNSRVVGTGTAELVVGGEGQATLNINSGGALDTSGAGVDDGNAFFGAVTGGTSNTSVNAGTLAIGGAAIVAGNGGLDAGNATITLTNGSVMTADDGLFVFTTGTVSVGTGTSAARFSTPSDVGVDGTIHYNAGTFTATGTLDVAGNVLLSSAARNGAGTPSNKKLLEVGQATLTSSGVIDLNDNDMLIHDTTAGALQKYENFIRTARNNGLWNQPGITSTAAKNSVPKNKNLGAISGANFQSANGGAGALFNGRTVAGTDTLIKFTFNGDTDLNGVVNFDDYARTDSGFNNNRSGWFNGDFDYNGIVNFDDYSLIDQSFNTQGGVILATGEQSPAGPGFDREIVPTNMTSIARSLRLGTVAMASDGVQYLVDGGANGGGGGGIQAVPEPATIGLFSLAMLGSLSRRRRSR